MVADWVVVELEPAGAARSGLPARLAVPREVAERGDPIERVRAAEWARAFVAGHADHELAATAARAGCTAEPLPPPGRAPAARGALRGGRPGARSRDRADAVRRGLALQSRRRAAARRRARARAHGARRGRVGVQRRVRLPRAARPIWEALDEQTRAVLAYERALELAPGDGFVLERLEHLGALMRIEGPDGEVFWLTPGDFERVMRHELASASNDPDQLVALGDRLLGGGHVALAASAAELALAGSDDSPRRVGARGSDACGARPRAAGAGGPGARRRARSLQHRRRARARAARRRPRRRPAARARRGAAPPGSAAAWIVLGDYLAAAAQPREALGAYAHALDLDPALSGAEHAREALRVLG